MIAFNAAQYEDLKARPHDPYARTKYDILLGWLGDRPGLRVLNAGCGSGELSLRLAERGHRVTGIDPQPAHVKLARSRAGAAGGRCTFEVAAIEDYDGPADFDCAIATDVLEHIADDRTAFSKLCRLVRPGGRVLIAVPAGVWLMGHHDRQLGHFRRYSRRELVELAGEFCAVRRVRHFGFSLIPVCYLYSRWLRRSYPVAPPAGLAGVVRELLLRGLLCCDRWLPMPVGTSLLLEGYKTGVHSFLAARRRRRRLVAAPAAPTPTARLPVCSIGR
jgi:SAM-dependent methyltransferase